MSLDREHGIHCISINSGPGNITHINETLLEGLISDQVCRWSCPQWQMAIQPDSQWCQGGTHHGTWSSWPHPSPCRYQALEQFSYEPEIHFTWHTPGGSKPGQQPGALPHTPGTSAWSHTSPHTPSWCVTFWQFSLLIAIVCSTDFISCWLSLLWCPQPSPAEVEVMQHKLYRLYHCTGSCLAWEISCNCWYNKPRAENWFQDCQLCVSHVTSLPQHF